MQGQQKRGGNGEKKVDEEFSIPVPPPAVEVDEEFGIPVPPPAVDEGTKDTVERSCFRLSNKNNLNQISLQCSKNNVLFTTNILISHTIVTVKPTTRAKMKWKFNVFDGQARKCN
jgi:hypothetical protein